jgi:hypothetical protein
MNENDALTYMVTCLRQEPQTRFASYGYELYIPIVLREFLRQHMRGVQDYEVQRYFDQNAPALSSAFYAAAWNLCRRGILRPGIRAYGLQATEDGGSGNGYTVTPFGRQWLSESDRDDFVPTEPERFGQLLARSQQVLGMRYQERGQEAVRCYGAHAYLACCAMCGAAAESILLTIAIAKTSEARVLSAYRVSNGRSRVENMVVGQLNDSLRREFQGFTTLLKYWRDEASHGGASRIGDNEAYTSLAMLLRFAQFASDHWEDLTKRSA